MNYYIRLAINAAVILFFGSMLAIAVLDDNTHNMLIAFGGIILGIIGAIDASHHHHSATVLKQRLHYHTTRADLAEADAKRLRLKIDHPTP